MTESTNDQARRIPGVAIAGVTALVSGVSVFVNSYGVKDFASPSVYTTAKNLVAAAVLCAVALGASRAAGSRSAVFTSTPRSPAPRRSPAAWVALAYVGVIGGGLAFVLFFQGLSLSEPASAALWRDTLVLWVALFAGAVLREKVRWWNLAAIALLVVGEVTVTGGVGQLAANHGELDVLASSVLWAVEIVIAKRLLRDMSPAALAIVRMGGGGLALVAYLGVTGSLGALVHLDAAQAGWVLLTGLLLALYVGTWMTALAHARALDVTSVLVAGAVVTWLLQWLSGATTPAPSSWGLVLIALGAALVGVAMTRTRREARSLSA
jgi:drug/metabolite transporter (DMT)-like permease